MSGQKKSENKTRTGIVLGIVFLIIILFGIRGFSTNDTGKQMEESRPAPSEKLMALRAHEEEILTTYGPAGEEGYYRIPIERAKHLLIREAAQKQAGD